MTHTNGQAKYKDLCFTFDDLQAAFCSGYTKGYNDSDSNEERTVSPIEGQLSVSEIVKRRKNLPATAPANGEEWSKNFRKFIESSIVWDRSYPDGFNQDAVEDYVRTLKLKWEEAERKQHGALCPQCNDYMTVKVGQKNQNNVYYCEGCNQKYTFVASIAEGEKA